MSEVVLLIGVEGQLSTTVPAETISSEIRNIVFLLLHYLGICRLQLI